MSDITLLPVAISLAVAFLVTMVSIPIIANRMRRWGIVGRDVHKASKPEIPEMCGLAILVGLFAGGLCYALLAPSAVSEIVAFLGTILIAGVIGIIDDLHPLGARLKPILTAIACIPILVLGTYSPHPVIPLLGRLRLTLIYPLLIPIAIAVTSNAVNMMDVMNGAMAGTASVISIAISIILLLAGDFKVAALSMGLLGALLAFYYYNRFPAKVFGGDTGSLTVGAALGALSILGGIETVVVIALMPQIMNAFYGLTSVGGLYERRQIADRPTKVLENGKIDASPEKGAPVTLTRVILAAGPLSEREIVRCMIALTIVSSLLAMLTYWIMVGFHA